MQTGAAVVDAFKYYPFGSGFVGSNLGYFIADWILTRKECAENIHKNLNFVAQTRDIVKHSYLANPPFSMIGGAMGGAVMWVGIKAINLFSDEAVFLPYALWMFTVLLGFRKRLTLTEKESNTNLWYMATGFIKPWVDQQKKTQELWASAKENDIYS